MITHREPGEASDVMGCFERHLLRRGFNPLFPVDRQAVAPGDYREARNRDEAERHALKAQILAVLRPVMEGPDSVDTRAALDVIQELHNVLVAIVQSDQGLFDEIRALRDGHRQLAEAMKAVVSTEQAAQLDAATSALESQLSFFQAPLIATLLRADSPMRPEELVPSLLTLELAEFDSCLAGVRAIDDESLRLTVTEAVQLIDWAQTAGVDVPDASEKRHLLLAAIQDAG